MILGPSSLPAPTEAHNLFVDMSPCLKPKPHPPTGAARTGMPYPWGGPVTWQSPVSTTSFGESRRPLAGSMRIAGPRAPPFVGWRARYACYFRPLTYWPVRAWFVRVVPEGGGGNQNQTWAKMATELHSDTNPPPARFPLLRGVSVTMP